jgi:hypothetical protein
LGLRFTPVIVFLFLTGLGATVHADLILFTKENDLAALQGFITSNNAEEAITQLRIKKPRAIILNSYGGDISGAVQLAKYIHKNGINTWVPQKAVCASGCALIFLAGKERLSEGDIYLHQFMPTEEHKDKKISLDKAFVNVQKTIGEIVILLNEINAPDFVLERILTQEKLYRLTDADLAKLNTVASFEGVLE